MYLFSWKPNSQLFIWKIQLNVKDAGMNEVWWMYLIAHNTVLRRLAFCKYASSFCEEREKLKTMVMLHPQKVIEVWLKCSFLFGSRIKTWSRLNLVLVVLPSSLQTWSWASCLLECWGVWACLSLVGMWVFWEGKTAVLKPFKRNW